MDSRSASRSPTEASPATRAPSQGRRFPPAARRPRLDSADSDRVWVAALEARLGAPCMLAHLSCVAIRAPALWLVGFDSGSPEPAWRCEATLDGACFSHAGGSEAVPPCPAGTRLGAGSSPLSVLRTALGPPLRLGAYPGVHWSQTRFFEAIPSSALDLWARSPGADWEQIALGSGLDGSPHALLLAAALAAEDGVGSGSTRRRPVRI